MTQITGRTAFITGAAHGIGRAIAAALAHEGVKLALADLEETALERTRGELSAMTAVETVVLDVRDRAGFETAADAVESRLGPVSLLINNAGVAGGAPAHRMSYALWDWGMDVNLGGVVNGLQTFLPRMIARGGGGHIVNTASGAGLAAVGAGVLYHTAKFAVVGLSEALRAELVPFGIGVTVLCPGPVDDGIVARTRTLRPDLSRSLSPDELQAARDRSVLAAATLSKGVSPDAVGEMVLEGVSRDRLYIHTDRSLEDSIRRRGLAILEAMRG